MAFMPSFGNDAIPDRVSISVEASAQIARFNPAGTYAGHFLAVGCSNGNVCIYDFETRTNVVRTFVGHVKPITALCWSRRCRFLMSASLDWTVNIWDLGTGERRDTIRFDAPVVSASLHPRNSRILAVTLQNQAETVFVDLRPNGGRWELLMDNKSREDEDATPRGGHRRELATLVRFSPRGDLVFVGSSLGSLYIFGARNKTCIHQEKISPNASIHAMEFDRKGTALVVNSNDRTIRVFGIDDMTGQLVLHHKFLDHIGQTPWTGCSFSKDGEYVCAGAGAHTRGNKAAHAVHVWDRATGALVKILEGPKDPMEDFDWHPTRPVIATVSELGLIHVWVTQVVERWAAYAPGFEELEENVEYIEREDEFDVLDAQELDRRKQDEEGQFVDILTTDGLNLPDVTSVYASTVDDDVELDKDDMQEDFVPLQELDDFETILDNAEEAAALFKAMYQPASDGLAPDAYELALPPGAIYTVHHRSREDETASTNHHRDRESQPKQKVSKAPKEPKREIFEGPSRTELGLRDRSQRKKSALLQAKLDDDALLFQALGDIDEFDKRPVRRRQARNNNGQFTSGYAGQKKKKFEE